MTAPPRTLAQRTQDTRRRLDEDVDAWVATADRAGTPYLVPLSFLWDGETLLISTSAGNPRPVISRPAAGSDSRSGRPATWS